MSRITSGTAWLSHIELVEGILHYIVTAKVMWWAARVGTVGEEAKSSAWSHRVALLVIAL